MQPSAPTLVILHGNEGQGEAERAMASLARAVIEPTAARALAAGFARVILATDCPGQFRNLSGVEFDPDPPGETFAFQARLAGVFERFAIDSVAVMGGGALPLLAEQDFAEVARLLRETPRRVVTNNFFSSDLTAWAPASAIVGLTSLTRDNALPRRLRDETGFTPCVLPKTPATAFDLDTPSDATVLALQPGLATRVQEALDAMRLPLSRYRQVMRTLCDPRAELVVAGRVGSAAWQHLETETACRVRLFSEERGLGAAGREHHARSALGFLIEAVGVDAFFARMAELGDAIVLDSRVIEAHMGCVPSREDRFRSDLLQVNAIEDPFLRAFTSAALACSKPALLGGHSLVSGGLMALNDAAWLENDRLKGERGEG